MDYEVVFLEERIVAGLKTSTRNSDPEMPAKIGSLWQSFFTDGVWRSIVNKKNGKTIGLYTNYEKGVDGLYDVFVCCEVTGLAGVSTQYGIETSKIPAGKYARFVVRGDMQKDVVDFWQECWSMDLDRKFTGDFEEYQECGDMTDAEIHIYIALNG